MRVERNANMFVGDLCGVAANRNFQRSNARFHEWGDGVGVGGMVVHCTTGPICVRCHDIIVLGFYFDSYDGLRGHFPFTSRYRTCGVEIRKIIFETKISLYKTSFLRKNYIITVLAEEKAPTTRKFHEYYK